MALPFDEQDLMDMLSELEQSETVGWMSGMLYEVAVDELLEDGALKTEVGWAFVQLLRAELRYHREIQAMVDGEDFDLGVLVRLNHQHERSLEHNLEKLSRALPTSQGARSVREVGLAECCLRLGRLEEALTHMEGAMADGMGGPAVHLALGYLRYQFASRKHGPLDRLDETEWLSFQLACLRAVTCFEGGLGGDLDAQLYWWMGTVLESGGFDQAANEAFDKARAAEEAEDDEFTVDEPSLAEGELDETADAEDRLPQITALEEQRVFEDLGKPLDFGEMMGNDSEGMGE